MNTEVLEELIEYKFAPGPLLAVQGLVNTYSYEDGVELLPDSEAAASWLQEAGLIVPGTRLSDKDLEEILELRRALRDLLYANHGEEMAPDTTEKMRRLAKEHPIDFVIDQDGKIALDLEPAESAGELIAQVIGIIAQSQDRDEWKRLKICPAEDCRWAFYDRSKNQGGTWCRMEVCGNRNKNRKYRSKDD